MWLITFERIYYLTTAVCNNDAEVYLANASKSLANISRGKKQDERE